MLTRRQAIKTFAALGIGNAVSKNEQGTEEPQLTMAGLTFPRGSMAIEPTMIVRLPNKHSILVRYHVQEDCFMISPATDMLIAITPGAQKDRVHDAKREVAQDCINTIAAWSPLKQTKA